MALTAHVYVMTSCTVLVVVMLFGVIDSQQVDQLQVSLQEEQDAGTQVVDVSNEARLYERFDVNTLSTIHYSIVPSTDPNLRVAVTDYFEIPSNRSTVLTRRRIDRDSLCVYRESACFFTLEINLRLPTDIEFITLLIHIIDINDNRPEFPEQTVSLSIPESSAVGATFEIPTAEDADAGEFSVQSYQLQRYQDIFELRLVENNNRATLSLGLLQRLDREVLGSYVFTVTATDGGTPAQSGSVTVQVSVLDTNDNHPVFEQQTYHVTMSENNAIGSSVVQVRADDPDDGLSGQVQYEFSRQTDDQYGSLFHINVNTGLISTDDVIDYELDQNFTLHVVAKDLGPTGLAGYAQVLITVRDLNDNAPLITVNTVAGNDHAEVRENQPVGQTIAYVSVSDPDGGDNGDVTCVIDDAHFRLEEVTTKKYKIQSAMVFDREQRSEYVVTMTCRDRAASARVTSERIVVEITDENDHTPVFARDEYTISLHENSGLGITVLQVNATDEDSGQNAALTFELQPIGLYGSHVLDIDPQTGVITTRTSLDYESHTQYSYYVIAHDNGDAPLTATASLLVNVLDTNDNAPVFAQPKYTFTVPEHILYNSVIGRVQAFDMDSPPYNRITYALASHGWESFFHINPNTGDIHVTTLLDKEQMGTRQSYDLVAQANDGYSRQSSVEVTVFVQDINDNPPVITYPSEHNNSVNIKSNAKRNRLVTSVEAYDRDVGRNGLLTFALRHSDVSDLFFIDRHTGNLYVNRDLTDHGNDEIELTIEVSDNGETPITESASLFVYINKVAASQNKALVTNLSFVIAVVITSVFLVAIVVILFIIFLLRRSSKQERQTPVYSYQVETKDEGHLPCDAGTAGGVAGVSTVSGSVVSAASHKHDADYNTWPDVVDVNQVNFDAVALRQHRAPAENNYVTNATGNKRVHFKDSLESVHSAGAAAACDVKTKAPLFLDEGRHKLLYGADARALQQLAAQNLQNGGRGGVRDADDLSDQGSSVDSGRGPSEEDPDALRSSTGSQSHSTSFNDSRDSADVTAGNNYIDMSQVRKHMRPASGSSGKYVPSTGPSTRQVLMNPQGPVQRDTAPRIAPRASQQQQQQQQHPRTAIIHPQYSRKHNSVDTSFPDLNVPASAGSNSKNTQKSKPAQNSAKTAQHGLYNPSFAAAQSPVPAKQQQQLQQQQQARDSNRCERHNVINHFPELCHREIGGGGGGGSADVVRGGPRWQDRPLSDVIEPDSRSEGGSTTSGSYMVDSPLDHMDLGPEISCDVFV